MVPLHDDLVLIQNASLRDFVVHRRAELQQCYDELRSEMALLKVGEESDNWRKNSPASMGSKNRFRTSPILAGIYDTIVARLDGFKLSGEEIWFGGEHAVPAHNDAAMFLESGTAIGIQIWALLDSPLLDQMGHGPTTRVPQGCLNFLLPRAHGPVFPGMDFVLSPEGKREALPPDRFLGDALLTPGDFVIFKNGVVHYKEKSPPVTRVAMAFRGILKEDFPLDPSFELWFYSWMSEHLNQLDDETQKEFERNEYFQRWLKRVAEKRQQLDDESLNKALTRDHRKRDTVDLRKLAVQLDDLRLQTPPS